MKQTCARSWEVEAVRDHRLAGEALRSAEQHRARCGACTREHESLELLAAKLLAAGGQTDELALRRSRNVVLEKASRPDEARPSPRWRPLVAAGLVAAAAGVVAIWSTGPTPVSALTPVVITASEGASYSRMVDAKLDRVDLVEGVLDFDVRQHAAGRRFVVAVPDGEIEDVGTRFRVTTHGGQTEEISVEEGAVVFRRPGRSSVELGAGQIYRAESTRSVAAAEGGDARRAPEPSRSPAVPAPIACVNVRGTSAPSSAGSPVPHASNRQAAALERPRGIAPSAAPSTAGFIDPAAAPSSTGLSQEEQAEDEAYLRVVALLRENRREEAKVAARAFVARFPSGLRRREMDVVAE